MSGSSDYCAAPNCSNCRRNQPDLSYFSFPTNKESLVCGKAVPTIVDVPNPPTRVTINRKTPTRVDVKPVVLQHKPIARPGGVALHQTRHLGDINTNSMDMCESSVSCEDVIKEENPAEPMLPSASVKTEPVDEVTSLIMTVDEISGPKCKLSNTTCKSMDTCWSSISPTDVKNEEYANEPMLPLIYIKPEPVVSIDGHKICSSTATAMNEYRASDDCLDESTDVIINDNKSESMTSSCDEAEATDEYSLVQNVHEVSRSDSNHEDLTTSLRLSDSDRELAVISIVPESCPDSSDNLIQDKLYSCSICQISFRSTSGLDQHNALIHTKPAHSCGICQMSFTQNINLERHMLSHTAEKPHSCSFCQRSFRLKDGLRKHVMPHTGRKPYSCKICNTSFRQKCGLNQHMTMHTEKKQYPCTLCKRNFTRSYTLENHMLTHKILKYIQ